MKIRYLVKYTVSSIRREGFKAVVNILINSITIALLLCSSAFAVATLHFIDKNLNDLNGEVVYRRINLIDVSQKAISDKNEYVLNLKKMPHVESVEILNVDEENNLYIRITVDDYRNIKSMILALNKVEYYNVQIDDRSMFDINVIGVTKTVSLIILIIVVLLTLSTILLSLRKSIDEKQYEIALLKSIGYNKKHLFILIFTESVLVLIISYILSIVLTKLILIFTVNPILEKTIVNNLVGRSVDLDIVTIIASFLACIVFALASSASVLHKTNKISPFMLLKS